MAASTYCVTLSEDDWGETADQYATRPEADRRLAEVEAAGQFGRLIKWQGNQSLEVKRVNADKSPK